MNNKIITIIFVSFILSVYLPYVKGIDDYVNVSVSEAKNMMENNFSLIVLDVRNQSEYDSGHIRNAKLIPVWNLTATIDELDKEKETLVYCGSGFRSASASETLVDHGFSKVYNIVGGINEWVSADYPIYIRYLLIQEALDNANTGDTVRVSSGVYYEHLTVSKSLALVGESKKTTIIDGTNNGTVVQVTANNVSIMEFTLRNNNPCPCSNLSGINVGNVQNVSLTNNVIMQNGYGIRLGLVSDSIVACNDIIGNGYGVHLGSSFGNIFYHNNFVESTISQASGGTLLNAWDNGVEGNYWSNYSGVDSNHDGIGDSWHEINQNNVDHYPLMGMFSNFNVTSEYSVQTVCNSTVSDFYFNGTAILFNVSGENDTCGFCRICIPTALINETYRIFVNGTQVLYDLLSDISNATHTYLYFTHNHSMQEVIVIPELSSLLNMLLFITTTLLLVVVFTKKFQLLAS